MADPRHLVLYNDDLLTLIFQTIYVSRVFDSRGRACCAAASLVCKIWTEPASLALWRVLPPKFDGLQPLLQILHPFPYPASAMNNIIGGNIREQSFYSEVR